MVFNATFLNKTFLRHHKIRNHFPTFSQPQIKKIKGNFICISLVSPNIFINLKMAAPRGL